MKYFSVFLLLFPLCVWADVSTPPPSPSFVHEKLIGTWDGDRLVNGLKRDGVDLNLKVWSIKSDGNSTTTDNNGTLHRKQTSQATFQDNHGAKATGKLRTNTRLGATPALTKAFGAYAAFNMFAAVVNSHQAHQAAQEIHNGNYGMAAFNAVAAFDNATGGAGEGAYNLFACAWYGSCGESIANDFRAAQQAKAEQWIAQNQTSRAEREALAANAQYAVSIEYHQTGETVYIPSANPAFNFMSGWLPQGKEILDNKGNVVYVFPRDVIATVRGVRVDSQIRNELLKSAAAAPSTVEDLFLSQQEMNAVIVKYLEQNLAQNAKLADAVAAALFKNGDLNAQNTSTVVEGSEAERTFITAPYTPEGAQVAQETHFNVSPDGRVTSQTVQRPDLAAHTSQAPTRAEIKAPATLPGTVSTNPTQNTPSNQQQQAEMQQMCLKNPDAVMCAQMGSADYQDLSIPTMDKHLDFRPASIFKTAGTCPQPREFSVFGKSFFYSYEPTCKFLEGVRPMIVLLGMFIAMMMAYSTVKEL